MKYILNKVFLLFIIVISFFTIKVYAIEKPTQEFYVNDYANVLSIETKNYIINKSLELYDKDKTQVVVSIVNSLDGLTVEEYALEMFREFGIGDKELNNGILLLLSVGDREVRIEVGYGLEGVINDGKAGRILDNYMIPDLRNNNWDSAIKKGYDAIVNEINTPGILGLEHNNFEYSNEEPDLAIIIGIIIVFIIINSLIAVLFRITNKKILAYLYLIFLMIGSVLSVGYSLLLSLIFCVSLISFYIAYFIRSKSEGNRGTIKSSSSWSGSSRSSSSWSSSLRSSSSWSSSSSSSFRSSSRGGGGSSGGGGASRKF